MLEDDDDDDRVAIELYNIGGRRVVSARLRPYQSLRWEDSKGRKFRIMAAAVDDDRDAVCFRIEPLPRKRK
jgi:hypothetical protein